VPSGVVRKRGYVALLDVLGFRELILRKEVSTEVEQYIEAIAAVASARAGLLKYVLFSDSVVFYSLSDGREAQEAIVGACSEAMHKLLRQGVAIRGAIAHGDFIRTLDPGSGIVIAGRPIVDAFEYEKGQDWIGIMVCPSVLREDPELRSRAQALSPKRANETWEMWRSRSEAALTLQEWEEIPFHGEPDLQLEHAALAVVPLSPTARLATEIKADLDATKALLENLRFEAPQPKAQLKYQAAKRFLDGQRERLTLLNHQS
jgi:hypothetical protein